MPSGSLPGGSRARTPSGGSGRGAATGAGLLAVLAVLLSGLLSGCGFSYATDRVYTPAHGANHNEAEELVTVLHAVVVSTEPGSGTFIATMTNKDVAEPVTFDSLAGSGESPVTAAEVTPVEIAPGGFASLAEDGGVEVTGEFEEGDFVEVVLGFDSGYEIALEVPVVPNSGYFSDLDGPAPEEESINDRVEHGAEGEGEVPAEEEAATTETE